MTYSLIALAMVLASVALDQLVVRTKLTTTGAWWGAYGIVVFFQLLTNGWLTGRGIVRYDPQQIIGGDQVSFVGDGRLFYAPVEDLAFGFALVLTTCSVWVWLGRRTRVEHR